MDVFILSDHVIYGYTSRLLRFPSVGYWLMDTFQSFLTSIGGILYHIFLLVLKQSVLITIFYPSLIGSKECICKHIHEQSHFTLAYRLILLNLVLTYLNSFIYTVMHIYWFWLSFCYVIICKLTLLNI